MVPTGFITAQTGIDKKIRQKLVDEQDARRRGLHAQQHLCHHRHQCLHTLYRQSQQEGDVVLIDASNLGTKVKEGKNQKTLL